MKQKKFYYENETTDEVVDFNIKEKFIDENYNYLPSNFLYKTISFITYRLIATPMFWIYFKFINPTKYVNKKILKKEKSGYFVYANHTNQIADGACPSFICFPKKPHIICCSSNVNIPFIGRLMKMWGALPIPNTIQATKNFHQAIEECLSRNQPIIIYPEAHLWPYYTKIRPFDNISFRYPIKYNKPIYIFTTTYVKRKFFKKPKTVIYVDGPFYHNNQLPPKQSQQKLRDDVFNVMNERSKMSNYAYTIYEKRSNND
jgi:1-acyl-sn-glycerol-3-phosphate acyltransferase